MPYTLWSHGRLLGETELEYTRCVPLHRGGGLWPTVAGSKLMPVATGVTAATLKLAAKSRQLRAPESRGTPPAQSTDESCMQQSTEYADYAAAVDQLNALALELRGPSGAVIPTEWIEIRDTEFLADLASRELEDAPAPEPQDFDLADDTSEPFTPESTDGASWMSDEEFIAQMQFDVEPASPRPFPLYQIHVCLYDESAIP